MPAKPVPAPRRPWPQALLRALRLLGHVLRGLWTVRHHFPRWDEAERARRVQDWARRLLELLGVRLRVHGAPPPQGSLVVANHVSWLDIMAVDAVRPCRFIAKADVHRWPLLGALVAGAGTLFIERTSRRDALRVVHLAAERLQAGDVLAFFPEGTTSDGSTVLPFHANLLQAALATGRPVVPLGIAYRHASAPQQRHDAPVYVGDMTLLASLWRVLRAPDLAVELHWGAPQTAQGRDRRVWAADLRAEVARLAGLPPPCG
ncbi:1-acyl-sn-glycerol-3-phosphate acyltransferase [Tepidimonas alkaliphilus]|uniref:1-acyl-sn-glycerol-3-phosphate acyltransferase n=1 Tax=Tepidimonas alkaliphilus TaxID=2588942 RepID=A0A554W5H7_9BURK|nr:lysophospholipid acyltransferase family protein [Tepidimonas alkaliphilus]TSE18831.1 1-acyl-sn-glycerol-3-phosphate acyltransferase [Tepidimonas alkaliphilus]